MKKWEYLVIGLKGSGYTGAYNYSPSIPIDPIENQEAQDQLNELGEQGWELVGLSSMTTDRGTHHIKAYMKRPR